MVPRVGVGANMNIVWGWAAGIILVKNMGSMLGVYTAIGPLPVITGSII